VDWQKGNENDLTAVCDFCNGDERSEAIPNNVDAPDLETTESTGNIRKLEIVLNRLKKATVAVAIFADCAFRMWGIRFRRW
jgi:hypothetical protein